jgi:hypothetical protein
MPETFPFLEGHEAFYGKPVSVVSTAQLANTHVYVHWSTRDVAALPQISSVSALDIQLLLLA